MKTNKNLSVVAAVLVVCVAVWFATSIKGGENTYELHPEIFIPEYRTDAARAIDAYERLMERYMNLTELNLTGINSELKVIVRRLNSIDRKLEELSAKIVGIEKALGIKQPNPDLEEKTQTKATQKPPSPFNQNPNIKSTKTD